MNDIFNDNVSKNQIIWGGNYFTEYYDKAIRRITNHTNQQKLF